MSPIHWSETVDSINECNARAGDPSDPDSVAFLGWEWSQVGSTPDTHYGHKNVIFLETDRALVPRRPIAAPRPEFRVAALPTIGRVLLSLRYFSERQIFADYQTYYEEVNAVPYCPEDVDTRELPLDCHEVAAHPSVLHRKLEEWGTPSIVIPHGTSWGLMTPRAFSLARELESGQHDPDRQLLFEIYSGHGSAQAYRDFPGARPTTDGEALLCPQPMDEYLPCCWQAGEIIRERCENESSPDCEERAIEARSIYLAVGAAAHLTVPGAEVDDWLDCDQCRDCFNPAFSHRPGGSAQSALTLRRQDAKGGELAYRFGLIGASDTHDARGGNGFKEFARLENTEALSTSSSVRRLLGGGGEPAARAEPVNVDEVSLGARRDVERGSSFSSKILGASSNVGIPAKVVVSSSKIQISRPAQGRSSTTRAIQEPTLAVNAGGLRCEYDANGRCIDVDPCYGNDRTDPSDDCLSGNEEHAWSSPIRVMPKRPLRPTG